MSSNNTLVIYHDSCPNCGGDITSDRLQSGLPCSKCLPTTPKHNLTLKELVDLIPPGNLSRLLKFENHLNNRENYFFDKLKKHPRTLQKTRTKRIFKNQSFSIIAPTGIGKSTRGVITSSYLSNYLQEGQSIVIVPTNLLVQQTVQKFKNLGIKKELLFYESSLSNKQKTQIKKQIQQGEFQTLIVTSNFLSRNFEFVHKGVKNLRFVFVDDVDSALKNGKVIEYIVKLVGFSEQDIKKVWELVKLQRTNQNKSNLTQKLFQYFAKKREQLKTSIVTSSASAIPKGRRILLLKYLLGFEIGLSKTNLRNIEDLYIHYPTGKKIIQDYEFLKKLINFFKDGILLFLPIDLSHQIFEIQNYLQANQIKAFNYTQLSQEIIDQFVKKNIQVLIGISSYKNPLARGIDLPQAAKYAIFWGVPKIIFKINEKFSKSTIGAILWSLQKILPTELKQYFDWNNNFPQIIKVLKTNREVPDKVQSYLEEILKNPYVKEIIKNSPEISFDGENFIIGDIAGYLQASGRVSRLYPGGLTKGLSILTIDNHKAFHSLEKKGELLYDIKFKPLDLSPLEDIN